MAKLVCQAGPTAGHEYPLTKDRTILGRQSTCDIQIMDTMSSRAHCEVRRDGRMWTLVDLGSRNGTNLNGRRVSERQLAFGDKIRVGEVEYVFVKEAGDVEIKDLLSKYEIHEKIGEGGMGIVYKATQRSMARTVALKILAPKYASRPKFVEQFIKEARAAGALNHPNIIQVHDVGSENGIHYFSMEFVEGATCMQLLKQAGALPVGDALEVVRQTAKALEYAHSQRLIHQDIKPDNIMVGENNQVKLADLGISKTFDEAEADAGANSGQRKVMGTPHYMAPEAALGKKVDHRVDIYALGATLYHLLTGKTPYHGTSATDVLKAHVMEPLPPIHDLNAEVPDDVVALVERMMAKKPDDRYQTAAEIAEEIRRLETGLGLSTERIAGPETMILRRFAKGGAAPAAGQSTASSTAGPTTGSTPAVPRSSPVGTLVLVGVILIGLVVVAIGVPKLLRSGMDKQAVQNPPPPVSRPPAPVAPAPPKPATEAPAQQAGQSAVAARFTALEQRLRQATTDTDPQPILKEIEDLRPLATSDSERGRLDAASQAAASLLTRRQAAARAAALGEVEQRVRQLLSERNFDLALQTVEKAEDPDGKLAALKPVIAQDKARFIAGLETSADQYRKQGNAAKLRELRDKLPAALVGTPIEQTLNDALAAVVAEQAKADLVVVAAAANDLAKWNQAALDARVKNEAGRLGPEAAKALADHARHGQRLTELGAALAAKLSEGSVRFTGKLGGWTDPDLMGASEQGLQVRAVGVPSAEVRWSQLKAEDLAAVGKLVLGKGFAPFAPSVVHLGQAQLAAEAKAE
ncbi:hypothetical protein LBMAG53_24350 [Planctomycetota bacterium]|nr:hypothetical protein LBMAG53_24350 [Planctomycetota bacterium]